MATHRLSLKQLKGAQVEVDFGPVPTSYGVFTVTDAAVSALSRLHVVQAGNAATGRSADENEMDPIAFSARASAGVLTITGRTLDGPVVGRYVVDYITG